VAADDRPVATVVVPARNCADTIGRTIALVDAQITASGRHCEIVVVDDASTDATHAAAQSAASACVNPVVCLRRETRGGPNASRNTGVRMSSAPRLVFLDGDDEPMAGWLVAMLDAVSGDDVIAGGAYRVERAGQEPVTVHPARVRSFGFPYALGGAMAMSRALVERVGGFDENIRRGGTEVEFCIQAIAKHGARVVPVPGACVTYRYPMSVVGRARMEFQREEGRRYLARRVQVDGLVAPPATAAAPQSAPERSRRAARRARVRRSGGWRLYAATRIGGIAGRRYFAWRDDALPARRGLDPEDS
jgi:glycosyltransferase involved in cell wall biosynthesis